MARDAERVRRRELEEKWNHIERRSLPPTFDKASREWQTRWGRRFAANILSIGAQALKRLVPVFGPRLLCDVTAQDIDGYQAKRRREGAQGRTVNIEVGVLRQVLAAHKLWLPRQSKTEAGSGRLIPLNPAVFDALAKWATRFPEARAEGYVFLWCQNRQLDLTRPTKGWRIGWRNALKGAGVKCRFHDLRVTCITKLAEGQGSNMTIMSIAGHVSRRRLEHGSRIRLDAKRHALEAIPGARPEAVLGVGVHQIGNQSSGSRNGASA